MVTLAQLQDEPWWGAEQVTPAMDHLADQLCDYYGQPRTAAGIRGDTAHLRGAHRSRSWILRSAYCTNHSYTVTYPDDLAGDENWCAGLDFNPGSTERLIAMCRRLDAAVRAGLVEEISEWYGNIDGDATVDGWNNVLDRAASSDSSHLWHVHITVKRRYAGDAAVMQRLFDILTGDDMLPDERAALLATHKAVRYIDGRIEAMASGRDAVGDNTAFLGVGTPVWLVEELKAVTTQVGELVARPPAASAEVDVAALAAVLLPLLRGEMEAAAEAAVRRVLGKLDETQS